MTQTEAITKEDQGNDAFVKSATTGLRGWLNGAQTMAVGLMSDPAIRRTAQSMRGAAGSIAKTSARAWARGFVTSKFLNYEEGRDRIEQVARKYKGTNRSMFIRRWAAVLHELGPEPHPAMSDGSEADDEWQQLTSGLVQDADGGEPQLAAAGNLMFQDESDPDSPPMTFREVFLLSDGLRLLIENFIRHPGSDEDITILAQLLKATLQPCDDLPYELATAIHDIAQAHPRSSKPAVLPLETLATTVAAAVSSLKINPKAESLTCQIKSLQEQAEARMQLATMIVSAAPSNPSHPGKNLHENDITSPVFHPNNEPTTPQSLHELQAAASTMQHLWELTCQLSEGTARRNTLLQSTSPSNAPQVLAQLKAAVAQITDGASDIESARVELARKRAQSEVYLSQRMTDLDTQLAGLDADISSLTNRRAELVAQLAQVDQELNSSTARRHEADEERSMFQEGQALSMDVMTQEDSDLKVRGVVHVKEKQAAQAACTLLARVVEGFGERDRLSTQSCRSSAVLSRNLWYTGAELLGARLHQEAHLLIQQMKQCIVELDDDATASDPDCDAAQRRLLTSYTEAETRLAQVRSASQSMAALLWFAPYVERIDKDCTLPSHTSNPSQPSHKTQPPEGRNITSLPSEEEKPDLPPSLADMVTRLQEVEKEASSLVPPRGARQTNPASSHSYGSMRSDRTSSHADTNSDYFNVSSTTPMARASYAGVMPQNPSESSTFSPSTPVQAPLKRPERRSSNHPSAADYATVIAQLSGELNLRRASVESDLGDWSFKGGD